MSIFDKKSTAFYWLSDPMERDLVGLYLQRAGLSVEYIPDTQMMIEQIKWERPVLVVLDVLLPGTSGLDLTHTIKKECTPGAPKVVLVSSLGFPEVVSQARNSGADDFIAKPLDDAQFIQRVSILINKALSAAVNKT